MRVKGANQIVAIFVVTVLAAACASDRMAGPDPRKALDLGPIMARLSIGGLGAAAARGSIGPAGQALANSIPLVPSSCAYSPASRSFVCSPVVTNGLTITSAFTLYDETGNPQAQPDGNTTASVRVITGITGTITLPDSKGTSGTLAVDRRDDMTLSGLNADHYTLNGTSGTHLVGSITNGGVTRPFNLSQTDQIVNVVLPPVSANAYWPLSGTIQSDIASIVGTGALRFTIPITVKLTFNGSGIVAATLTVNGVTKSCLLDLTNSGAGLACAA